MGGASNLRFFWRAIILIAVMSFISLIYFSSSAYHPE